MGNTPHEIKMGLNSLRNAKTIEDLQRSYDSFLSKGYKGAKVKEAESIFLKKVEDFANEIGYKGKDLFDVGLAKNPLAGTKAKEAMSEVVKKGNYLKGQDALSKAMSNMEIRVNNVPEYRLPMADVTSAAKTRLKATPVEEGSKSFITSLKSKLAKIPKGVKWAAAGVAVAGLVVGAGFLVKSLIDKKLEKVEDNTKSTTEQKGFEQWTPEEKTDEIVIPYLPSDELQKIDEAEKAEAEAKAKAAEEAAKAEEETIAEEAKTNTSYTVLKGDCVWRIAKKHLEEKAGRKYDYHNRQDNLEILALTNKIVDDNGLKWDKTHYYVMIKPGQILNIAA